MKCPSHQVLGDSRSARRRKRWGRRWPRHLSSCADCELAVTQLECGADTLLVYLRSALKAKFSLEPDCLQAVQRSQAVIASSDDQGGVVFRDVSGPVASAAQAGHATRSLSDPGKTRAGRHGHGL